MIHIGKELTSFVDTPLAWEECLLPSLMVLAQHSWIWFHYSACQASWAQHQVKFLITLSKVASYIGLSLLKYDLYLFFGCYQYYITKGSVLMHLVIYMLYCIFLNQLSTWRYSFPWLPNRGEDYYLTLKFVGNDSLVLLE